MEAVLVGYKELLLRYEALSRSLQQQLGFGDGNGPSSSGSGSSAGAPAAASRSPGHRSKMDQQQYGFGSLILPTGGGAGGDGSLGSAGRRASSAPLASPGSPSSSAASGSADASPSGKWSPGGILQRISSQAQRAKRSITPPRDRDGSRAAAAAETGSHSQQGGTASPGKPGQHPFFSTLFGSSTSSGSGPKVGLQQPQQQRPAAAPPTLRQPGEAGAGGSVSGAPIAIAPEAVAVAAAAAAADGPAVPGGSLPGAAPVEEQAGGAGMPADLIQLGSSSYSEEAGSLRPAPAEEPPPQQPQRTELWDASQQGNLVAPPAALDAAAAESGQGQAAPASLT